MIINLQEKASEERAAIFSKAYFNGGCRGGGYANEGYRDFPCHELTFRHVLARKPGSVLELGCGRGYIIKRLQDVGIPAHGIDISRHCYLTRVCNGTHCQDVCQIPWLLSDRSYDLCLSVSFWEHIPEEFLPAVIEEIRRTCKRGLHGIDFGQNANRSDKSKCTLRPKEWWMERLPPGHEVVLKDELEQGSFPPEVAKLNGIKLNVGCFTTMHHGWTNCDTHDLSHFAQGNGYVYQRVDVRDGLPFGTGAVDCIIANHMVEHLDYATGLRFFKDCRRVLKPYTGAMRIIVPDASKLISKYCNGESFADLFEVNDGCENAPTNVGKLWAMLCDGHSAAYDAETLEYMLREAGFECINAGFRNPGFDREGCRTIVRETQDQFAEHSIFMAAIPAVG